jgi:hypothetical protein
VIKNECSLKNSKKATPPTNCNLTTSSDIKEDLTDDFHDIPLSKLATADTMNESQSSCERKLESKLSTEKKPMPTSLGKAKLK